MRQLARHNHIGWATRITFMYSSQTSKRWIVPVPRKRLSRRVSAREFAMKTPSARRWSGIHTGAPTSSRTHTHIPTVRARGAKSYMYARVSMHSAWCENRFAVPSAARAKCRLSWREQFIMLDLYLHTSSEGSSLCAGHQIVECLLKFACLRIRGGSLPLFGFLRFAPSARDSRFLPLYAHSLTLAFF